MTFFDGIIFGVCMESGIILLVLLLIYLNLKRSISRPNSEGGYQPKLKYGQSLEYCDPPKYTSVFSREKPAGKIIWQLDLPPIVCKNINIMRDVLSGGKQ